MMINAELVEEETEMERNLTTNGVGMIALGVLAEIMANFANTYLGFESHYLVTSVLMIGGIGSILCDWISKEGKILC